MNQRNAGSLILYLFGIGQAGFNFQRSALPGKVMDSRRSHFGQGFAVVVKKIVCVTAWGRNLPIGFECLSKNSLLPVSTYQTETRQVRSGLIALLNATATCFDL